MPPLIIAAAQSSSIAGDLAGNIARHQRFMQIAAEHGVQLLVFPELSLTGYERGLAAQLALAPEAAVLQPLRDFAQEVGVTTVVGMPIRLSDAAPVLIGALVLGADGSLGVYSKQHLHPDMAARRCLSVPILSPWRCVQTLPMPPMPLRRHSKGLTCTRPEC